MPVISVMSARESKLGYCKSSSNGSYIASAYNENDIVDLLDFNNSNGVVSNERTFNGFPGEKPYGLEFSPNNHLLYVTSPGGDNPGNIEQFNINAGNDRFG